MKQETVISGKRLQNGLINRMEVYQVVLQKKTLIQISEFQSCKGKGDNMVESKEKALAPFLGTADALWIRVNAADSEGITANNVVLSDITVEDIEEEQIQTQIPQQQLPEQLLNYQPLETVNSQISEKNFEPLVEAPKHNYGLKINNFLEELQTSLSYQATN